MCGSHYAVAEWAKVLCSGYRQHGAEAVEEEANRASHQLRTGTVQAKGCGFGPTASGRETAKALDHTHGTGRMERVRPRVSAAGRMGRETLPANEPAVVGMTAQVMLLVSIVDSSSAVRETLLLHSVDSSSEVQERRRESIVHSLLGVPARALDIDHDGVSAAPVRQPYTDHGIVVAGLAILLYGGCSAVLEAPERRLEYAAGSA